jgi:SM-20-related protein
VRADAPVADAIVASGVAIVPGFLDGALTARLRERALGLDRARTFVAGGVGRGASHGRRADVRGDRIAWIDAPSDDASERALAVALDAVRRDVNRALSLGAFDLEMHYAIYPPGAGYARHRDRFRDDDGRVLSCVVYLNDAWGEGDGGALRLHLDDGARDVAPIGGTLVAFLSDRVEHEVLPARRDRVAVAAWYRKRKASG